ncbi:hypothetical protein PI124_g18561 [Phytophthora idaei]|nr:hypothetical protein PI125_g25301 [Phytophthora idaei]KAG3236429.1 hypothetical protein PI124_g18561 [Phytophthora idaei]
MTLVTTEVMTAAVGRPVVMVALARSHPSTKNIEVVEDDDVDVDGMGDTNDVDDMLNVSDVKT